MVHCNRKSRSGGPIFYPYDSQQKYGMAYTNINRHKGDNYSVVIILWYLPRRAFVLRSVRTGPVEANNNKRASFQGMELSDKKKGLFFTHKKQIVDCSLNSLLFYLFVSF